jgi:hypothetical protein
MFHILYSDPGFGYEQVIAVNPGLGDHGFTASSAQSYLDRFQARLRGVPGVVNVSLALAPPLVNPYVMLTSIDVDGRKVLIYPNWVTPEFFQTMSIPLLRGRYLSAGGAHEVMLSESLARRRWPNEDPIGKQWKDGKDIVVGVVGNTRAMEMNNTDATELYYPTGAPQMAGMWVLVRTAGSPETLSPAIKQIATDIDPTLFPAIAPLKVGFRKNVAQVEQIAALVSVLGGLAIFLAVIGLLGLVTYAVSQRTREIAIRLALGAGHAAIFSSISRRFAWPVLGGLILGGAATAGLSQVIRRALYGISGLDPISYAGALALLIAVLAVAAFLPVRRAFGINIARILHSE